MYLEISLYTWFGGIRFLSSSVESRFAGEIISCTKNAELSGDANCQRQWGIENFSVAIVVIASLSLFHFLIFPWKHRCHLKWVFSLNVYRDLVCLSLSGKSLTTTRKVDHGWWHERARQNLSYFLRLMHLDAETVRGELQLFLSAFSKLSHIVS